MGRRPEKLAKGTCPNKRSATARQSAIQLGEPDDYGPAMQKLTDTRKRFVIALVHYANGFNTPTGWWRSYTDAAWLAGIGGTRQLARIEGAKLMHNQFVLAAIREEDDKRAMGDLSMNRRTAAAIRDNPGAKDADRLKAAQWLDQLGGRAPRTEHLVTHEHSFAAKTTAELTQELQEFINANPQFAKIAGPKVAEKAPVIEAEFEEVKTRLPIAETFRDEP